MDERDIELRNLTYRLFVELARAPTADEVARAAGLTPRQTHAGWRRLHDAHALVVNPATIEIRMANPFSAVPTDYRVQAHGRWWFGNCAWDAFGILGALHTDGRIVTSCPDCGQSITLEVRDQRPDDESLLFHCLPPAPALVGRHHPHLKHDEPLPVGGAREALAGRPLTGRDDFGDAVESAGTRLVRRSPGARLAAAFA